MIGGVDVNTDPEMEYKGLFRELALAEFYHQGACLRSAHIFGASHVIVCLLSNSYTITQCTFHRPKGFDAELSLYPLGEVPHLTKLE